MLGAPQALLSRENRQQMRALLMSLRRLRLAGGQSTSRRVWPFVHAEYGANAFDHAVKLGWSSKYVELEDDDIGRWGTHQGTVGLEFLDGRRAPGDASAADVQRICTALATLPLHAHTPVVSRRNPGLLSARARHALLTLVEQAHAKDASAPAGQSPCCSWPLYRYRSHFVSPSKPGSGR